MRGWISVGLDGTLAHFSGWKGLEQIGGPVPTMLEQVPTWIRDGTRVKIFTARCTVPEHIPPVLAWLEKHGLEGLEVTNVKDYDMIELWDDRCVQVLRLTPITLHSAVGG